MQGFVSFRKLKPVSILSEIIGKRDIKVTRILYNEFEPITGIVPIQKGIYNRFSILFPSSR